MPFPLAQNFNGLTNGATLQSQIASFTQRLGTFTCTGTAVRVNDPPATAATVYEWTADTPNTDHECSARINFGTSFQPQGPAVRVASTGACYAAYTSNTGQWWITRIAAGGAVSDLINGTGVATGSIITIRAVGSTISAYDDGVLLGSVVDATHATGGVGLFGFGVASDSTLDDWSADNVVIGSLAQRIPTQPKPVRRRVPSLFERNPVTLFDRALPYVSSGGSSPQFLQTSLAVAVQAAAQAAASLAVTVQAQASAASALAAAVQVPNSLQASLAATVQASAARNASLAAAIQQANNASASLAAVVSAQNAVGSSVAASVLAQQSLGAAVSAQIEATGGVSAALSVSVLESRSASTSLAAAVGLQPAQQASIQAAIQSAVSVSAALATAIQAQAQASAAVSLNIGLLSGVAAGIDAAVRTSATASTGVSANIEAGGTRSASVSAMVLAASEVGAQVSAAVQSAQVALSSVALAIADARVEAASIAAAVAVQRVVSAATDLAIQALYFNDAGVSLYIDDGSGPIPVRLGPGGGYNRGMVSGSRGANLSGTREHSHEDTRPRETSTFNCEK